MGDHTVCLRVLRAGLDQHKVRRAAIYFCLRFYNMHRRDVNGNATVVSSSVMWTAEPTDREDEAQELIANGASHRDSAILSSTRGETGWASPYQIKGSQASLHTFTNFYRPNKDGRIGIGQPRSAVITEYRRWRASGTWCDLGNIPRGLEHPSNSVTLNNPIDQHLDA